MNNDPRKPFSAADIDRYLRGEMTPSEQYELERAALSDPLLSEAIDGFTQATGTDWQPHLDRLQQRIQQHQTDRSAAVVVSMPFWKNIRQLAAVLLALTALGAGLWALFQPEEKTSIAKEIKPPKPSNDTTPTTIAATTTTASIPTLPVKEPTQISPRSSAQAQPVQENQAVPPPVIAELSEAPYRPAESKPTLNNDQLATNKIASAQADLNRIDDETKPGNPNNNAPVFQEVVISNAAPMNRPEVVQVESMQRRKALDQRNAVSNVKENDIRAATKSAQAEVARSLVQEMEDVNPKLISYSGQLEPTEGWTQLERSIQIAVQQKATCHQLEAQSILVQFYVNADGTWRDPAFTPSSIPAGCQEIIRQVLEKVRWKTARGSETRHQIRWSW